MHAPIVLHFKGGSLGGRTEVRDKFDLCGSTLRVPVCPEPQSGSFVSSSAPLPWPTPIINYTYDEYRLERRISECEWEMRWVRPKDLSGELAQVKARLADAEEALDALNKLKKWFRKN